VDDRQLGVPSLRDRCPTVDRAALDALDANEAARDAVLRIKEAAVERGERAHGRWVYEAVLDGGVRSYGDYLAWRGDRDVWERSEWTPASIATA